jgi:hypothetical protein
MYPLKELNLTVIVINTCSLVTNKMTGYIESKQTLKEALLQINQKEEVAKN